MIKYSNIKIISIILTISLNFNCVQIINASIGDNSDIYNECMTKCWFRNCTTKQGSVKYSNQTRYDLKQPTYLKILGWDCTSECKYICMWKTVNFFTKVHNYVPQFYGKWPFLRVFGVQEPASTIASILNFISIFSRNLDFDVLANVFFFFFR